MAVVKSEDVVSWREALIRLSDQHFFDLMRMYLGAVRTPFNKQKLVEDLSSFLRKKETKDRIVLCLDEFDRMVLSAIDELPSPTQQKIIALFSGSKTFPEIYDRILNLEERLVIYRKGDSENREYGVNPLLADELAPYSSLSVLVRPESKGDVEAVPARVDDLSLAALYSFFLHEGDAVKNDGTFRKKTLGALEAVFPQIAGDAGCLGYLVNAFQNLGLLVKVEGRLVPDPGRWQSFAKEDTLSRFAWLIAAAGTRLSREQLRDRAQVFLDFYAALEDGARYRPAMVERLALILAERSGRPSLGRQGGRFTAMMREAESAGDAPEAAPADMTTVAKAFGLILEIDGLFAKNPIPVPGTVPERGQPYLVVSPSLEVTVMPGYPLAELLPLALCMEVRDIQIAGQFEITRRSCAVAFDQGVSASDLISRIRSRSGRALPQNAEFSIDSWFRLWSSVSLYHGYVLRADENRRILFENDEYLSSLIRMILAPGVYLLDADTPDEIQNLFSRADLDFLPSVSSPLPKRELLDFPALRRAGSSLPSRKPRDSGGELAPVQDLNGEFQRYRSEMLEALEALALPLDQSDALRSRVDRRIVLSPSQLDPESVRIEKVEARGMDFFGKVRIAEYALASGSLLEIVLDEQDGNRNILGRPVSTEKRTGDVILKLVTEPDRKVELVSLGKAVLVRRIRGSIFSELPLSRT